MAAVQWIPLHDAIELAATRWLGAKEMDEQSARDVVNRILDMLRSGSITVCYTDPFFRRVNEVPKDFWALPESIRDLIEGQYWPIGRPINPWDRNPACAMYVDQQHIDKALCANLIEGPTQPTRQRGPKPKKRNAVKAAMIAHGDMEDLSAMTEEVMHTLFGASRDVCRQARREVLSEFAAARNSDQ